MSKKLNENHIVNELKGRSLFFPGETETTSSSNMAENALSAPTERLARPQGAPTAPKSSIPSSAPQPPSQTVTDPKKPSSPTNSSPLLQHQPLASLTNPHESKTGPVEQASPNHAGTLEDENSATQAPPRASQDASVPARMLAQYDDDLIQEIRKTVKAYGKEVSYVRLTPEEKKLLAEIAYIYKSQGVKTSENEINRIAVNFLLMDYRTKGKESILSRVIEALVA